MVDLKAKRRAVREALQQTAGATERRVYNLPVELIGRILDYQGDHLLSSEAAAVRELLEAGLKAKGFPK